MITVPTDFEQADRGFVALNSSVIYDNGVTTMASEMIFSIDDASEFRPGSQSQPVSFYVEPPVGPSTKIKRLRLPKGLIT